MVDMPTPRPWKTDDRYPGAVMGNTGHWQVAMTVMNGVISPDERDANTRLIVEAVNAYDSLRTELTSSRQREAELQGQVAGMRAALEKIAGSGPVNRNTGEHDPYDAWDWCYDTAKAALAATTPNPIERVIEAARKIAASDASTNSGRAPSPERDWQLWLTYEEIAELRDALSSLPGSPRE